MACRRGANDDEFALQLVQMSVIGTVNITVDAVPTIAVGCKWVLKDSRKRCRFSVRTCTSDQPA